VKTSSTKKKQDADSWALRYSEKHRLHRILQLPAGIATPKRVRIYSRSDHYVLQWWDRGEKRTLSERVEGDLVQAIIRARDIDEQLENFRSAGCGCRNLRHHELVQKFYENLHRRADAGEIDPKTVARYKSALNHYLSFVDQPHVSRRYQNVNRVDRDFVLDFMTYLNNLQVSPNGHPHTPTKRMVKPQYVLDVSRAMYRWASDPQGEPLLRHGFQNPFLERRRVSTKAVPDMFGEPDITVSMAVDFMNPCDAWQLPLFALYVFYGLRASEPCWLFRESIQDGWLKVSCDHELGYFTKGRRDKRLPLIEPLHELLTTRQTDEGILFQHRAVWETKVTPPLAHASREDLRKQYASRLDKERNLTAQIRASIRDQMVLDAGGLNYDHIEHEFAQIKAKLGWPAEATLKDFRHLFSTCMENAGMPEFYRKFLMGQSPGRAAIVGYTHLNQIRERYLEAVEKQMEPLVEALHNQVKHFRGGI